MSASARSLARRAASAWALGGLLLLASCSDGSTAPSSSDGCGAGCPTGQTCQAGVCVGPQATGGGPGAGGNVGTNTGGSTGATSTGGSTGATGTTGGSAGATSTGGSAGATSTGGSAGATSTGGSAGATSNGGSGGAPSTGGSGGVTTTGGSGGAATGGAGGTTAGQGGSASGGTPSTGGTMGTGVQQSAECPDITWQNGSGTKMVGSGMSVGAGEVYDGGMMVHEGTLEDCTNGNQDTVDALITVANNGTVKNVVMGSRVGDGIHCDGSCTIDNVWFPYVCDDAISALGGGTVTIKNSGFKNARDKTIQHNGSGTVNIDNVYVETAGKLYRSCGEGCSGSSSRTANISNVVAVGVDQIAGISENDHATLDNICMYRSRAICVMYQPGSSDESTNGVNGSDEGPNSNCSFTGAGTHALLDEVTGIPFTTDVLCGGPNAYKSGSTATSCVSGFDSCLKPCAPGGYGFKQITCESGRYAEGDGAICAMPTDPTAAQNLAQSRVMGATNMVDNNDDCSPEWAIGIETSNNSNYCVCVHKPGYYQNSNWLAWDCQRRWW